MTYRVRDIPALPLFFLLHLIFTLSSLFLRVYELLTASDGDATADDLSATPSSLARRETSPPKHVGMVILSPNTPSRNRGRVEATRRPIAGERSRMVECVLNLVELAAEEGVKELSVYERTGLLESVKADISAELMYLPPSPPASEPRVSSGTGTPLEELHEVEGSKTWKTRNSDQKDAVTTLTVFPSSTYHALTSLFETSARRITIHLLPPSACDVVATVTNAFKASSIDSEDISPDMLDAGIRNTLHLSKDPDLLIVHSLYEPTGWRSWLPRPAPELGGYPFWMLRITEIYHHSPSLPLLSFFKPLLHLARSSPLPFLRKLGRLVPPPPHIRNEMLDLYDGAGRIDREEWDGAMRAWSAVEQRLGR